MYPHPILHSFMQGCNSKISGKVLNRMMDEAALKETNCRYFEGGISRLSTMQPQCYAPHVDMTRARCAYGALALPKLKIELHLKDPLIVRQAVTTIADILVNPEKLSEAIKLRIPARLSDLLVSQDSYLRERVAMAFTTIAGQSIGREAILKNVTTICNLSKGLEDRLAAVRIKMALAVEMLSRQWNAAEDLCSYGFIELIVNRLTFEKKTILVVLLDILQSLLDRDFKLHAIEIGILEKLMILLRRKNEEVLAGALSCLAMLCQESTVKQIVIDKDLFPRLREMLDDQRAAVHSKAVSTIAFVTTTTAGKLLALKLQIIGRLLELAGSNHCRESRLMAMKWELEQALTNISEAPEGRSILLNSHLAFIEDIDTCQDMNTQKHKEILLKCLLWQP